MDFFRIGSVVWEFALSCNCERRVCFVDVKFSNSVPLAKSRQGSVNGDACQPGRESRSSIKILKMDERIQKTVLHCVFCVSSISGNPMGDIRKLLDMAFAKFSKEVFLPIPGDGDQLVLTARSLITKFSDPAIWRN
jgi:hypothetical protein